MNWCTIMSHTEIFLTVVTGSSPYTLSALQFGLQHPSQLEAMSSSGPKPGTQPHFATRRSAWRSVPLKLSMHGPSAQQIPAGRDSAREALPVVPSPWCSATPLAKAPTDVFLLQPEHLIWLFHSRTKMVVILYSSFSG